MGKKKDRKVKSTDKKVDGKLLKKEDVEALEKSNGTPLQHHVRMKLEKELGRDLKDVRVHTGQNAFRLTKQLNAPAFTIGTHVCFGPGQFSAGQYNSVSELDESLLLHELTHAVQQ